MVNNARASFPFCTLLVSMKVVGCFRKDWKTTGTCGTRIYLLYLLTRLSSLIYYWQLYLHWVSGRDSRQFLLSIQILLPRLRPNHLVKFLLPNFLFHIKPKKSRGYMNNSFQKGPIQWEMKVSVRIARQPRQKVHTYDKYRTMLWSSFPRSLGNYESRSDPHSSLWLAGWLYWHL